MQFDFDKLLNQLAEVRKYPIPFLVACCIIGSAVWGIAYFHYGGIIESQKADINTLKDEAKTANEMANYYKERYGVLSTANPFHTLRNRELKSKAVEFGNVLRDLLASIERQSQTSRI